MTLDRCSSLVVPPSLSVASSFSLGAAFGDASPSLEEMLLSSSMVGGDDRSNDDNDDRNLWLMVVRVVVRERLVTRSWFLKTGSWFLTVPLSTIFFLKEQI